MVPVTTTNLTIDTVPAIPAALEGGWEVGLRGRELLELALRSQADIKYITLIITNYYPGNGDEKFTWMAVLERAGYTKAQLVDMLHEMFRATDPNADIASHHMGDFLRAPGSWWIFETVNSFIESINGCVMVAPGSILQFADSIAAKIGALKEGDVRNLDTVNNDTVNRYQQIGQNEAMSLVRQAFRKVRVLNSMAQVDTALKLRRDELSRLCEQIMVRQATTHHLTRQEVVLFAAALANDRLTLETQRAVERSILQEMGYRPPRTNSSETELDCWHRPVRLYRWIMWTWRHYPFKVTKQVELKQKLKQKLEHQGWRFAHVANHIGRNGHELRTEVLLDGDRKNIYIVPNRPERDESLYHGDEVIVPKYVDNRLPVHFARANERGYLYEMHVAGPPSPGMMRAVEGRTNY